MNIPADMNDQKIHEMIEKIVIRHGEEYLAAHGSPMPLHLFTAPRPEEIRDLIRHGYIDADGIPIPCRPLLSDPPHVSG